MIISYIPEPTKIPVLNIKEAIKPNTSKNSKTITRSKDEHYDTTHKKRGIALVFNHKIFYSTTSRPGTDRDRDNISRVLQKLGFEVRIYQDYRYSELYDILEKTSKEDHSENDCLVVALMSHGDKGILYAMDQTYPVDLLWENFLGDKCPTLIGKPKLFFIQACRGEQVDPGVTFSRDSVDSGSSRDQVNFTIPKTADLLVMYSTYEGHYAWRNPDFGSWFIQAICMELTENGKDRDLLTLLTGVSRRVAYNFKSNVPGDVSLDAMKQMPCIVSMLTKILYFDEK